MVMGIPSSRKTGMGVERTEELVSRTSKGRAI
jgi:hypothetical protein